MFLVTGTPKKIKGTNSVVRDRRSSFEVKKRGDKSRKGEERSQQRS